MELKRKYLFTTAIILTNLLQFSQTIKLKYMKQGREILSHFDGFGGSAVNDPCYRKCIKDISMTCKYHFLVESYTSMGLNCKDCPFNITDCDLPGCVPGGGIQRPIIAINRRTPGPDIQVCEGDTVIVDVVNTLKTEGITIHWHGLHQVGTSHMDGTPYITQCPILPYNTFRYEFTASPHGTHMWHGHVGFQDCDGLYGKLIVRKQENKTIQHLYDYDLAEHSIIIWHWYNWLTQGILENILHVNGSVYGFGLLINGKGILKEFEAIDGRKHITTPREVFNIDQGKKYLFRVIFNSAIYCPVQLSIDNHTLLMSATGTTTFEPIEVDSFMINAGERFNFILWANQNPGCYWMRFRGLGDCGEKKSSIHQEAFVCYKGFEPDSIQDERPTYNQGKRPGTLFNPVEVVDTNFENNTLRWVTEMKTTEPQLINITGTPDVTLYFQMHSRPYDMIDYPGPWPQFNNITFEFPERPLLSQRKELKSDGTCTTETAKKHCQGEFCTCPYVEEIPLNALVEIVLVDISVSRQQDHPIHIHGCHFYIVATETVGYNISFDEIKIQNEKGEIKKNFHDLPGKDTVSVPNKGYSVIRFRAKNPGYWLFHCHVSNHMELGMAVVLQVGNHSEMTATPSNFPKCGNWFYKPETEKSQAHSLKSFLWFFHGCLTIIVLKIS